MTYYISISVHFITVLAQILQKKCVFITLKRELYQWMKYFPNITPNHNIRLWHSKYVPFSLLEILNAIH